MRLLGLVGSPRKSGNSYYLVREAVKAAKEAEPTVDTEIREIAELDIESCRACESCAEKPYRCIIKDDFRFILDKMKKADGILIASPRYGPLGVCPSKMQALLERLININYLPTKNNPDFNYPLEGKPCGLMAVSVEGRQNNMPLLHNLEQYALAYRLSVIHTSEWPWVGVSGKGNNKGDVLKDKEAIRNAKNLGSLLIKDIYSQKEI